MRLASSGYLTASSRSAAMSPLGSRRCGRVRVPVYTMLTRSVSSSGGRAELELLLQIRIPGHRHVIGADTEATIEVVDYRHSHGHQSIRGAGHPCLQRAIHAILDPSRPGFAQLVKPPALLEVGDPRRSAPAEQQAEQVSRIGWPRRHQAVVRAGVQQATSARQHKWQPGQKPRIGHRPIAQQARWRHDHGRRCATCRERGATQQPAQGGRGEKIGRAQHLRAVVGQGAECRGCDDGDLVAHTTQVPGERGPPMAANRWVRRIEVGNEENPAGHDGPMVGAESRPQEA